MNANHSELVVTVQLFHFAILDYWKRKCTLGTTVSIAIRRIRLNLCVQEDIIVRLSLQSGNGVYTAAY